MRLFSKPSLLAISDYYYVSEVADNGGRRVELDVQVTLEGAAAINGDATALRGWKVMASLHGPIRLELDAPPPRSPIVWHAEQPVRARVEDETDEEYRGVLLGDVEAAFHAWLEADAL